MKRVLVQADAGAEAMTSLAMAHPLDSAELSGIRGEALAFADRHGIESAEEVARIEMGMRHRAFMLATESMRKTKARVYSDATLGVPMIIVPGELARLADFTMSPRAIECIALLDEMIQAEARRYGMAPAQEPQR